MVTAKGDLSDFWHVLGHTSSSRLNRGEGSKEKRPVFVDNESIEKQTCYYYWFFFFFFVLFQVKEQRYRRVVCVIYIPFYKLPYRQTEALVNGGGHTSPHVLNCVVNSLVYHEENGSTDQAVCMYR